jgi:hypothetical protein
MSSFSDTINEIKNIIPNFAKESDIDEIYMNGAIEILTFTAIILGMNVNLHDAMFDDKNKRIRTESPEGIITIVLICLIAFVLIFFLAKYLSDSAGRILEPISWVLYIIIIFYSLLIWTFNNVYKKINGMFNSNSNSGSGDFIFSDFDASLAPNYVLLFAFIGIIVSILYTAAYDRQSLTTNTYIYILVIVIPALYMFNYLIPVLSTNEGSGTSKLAMILMLVSIFSAVIYFYINMSSSALDATAYIMGGLTFLIAIVGLALLFYILGNYLKSFTGWSGFIVYLIFYIPCLLIDFSKYIMKEFQMTSKLVYVLFIVEIILILVYIYVPIVINKIDKKDGVLLLEDGAFLDIPMTIGSSKVLEIPSNKMENNSIPTVYQKNFSFSMWVYLNVQPSNFSSYSKETTIFNCGNSKPKIVYYNNIDNDDHKNKYIIYFTDVSRRPNSFEITLPNQKWNNFVFNYSSSKVDLFVNGVNVKTFTFKNNFPYYRASDNIVVGSDNGLDGAICNVRYYPYNLSVAHITAAYNLLMYKNPPVNVI